MNFDRTIIVPTPVKRSFVTEKETPDFDYEKTRVKQVQALAKKRTLGYLYNRFRKVFPNSTFDKLKVKFIDFENAEGIKMYIKSQIVSSTEKWMYQVDIVLYRDSRKERWSLRNKCEVKCMCKAFRYWIAYPDLLTKNFYGRPSKWNLVCNKVRNPKLVPGICKHIAYLIQQLLIEGVIKP